MRFQWRWALILMATMFTTGCGGEIPDNDLGEIIYEVPTLPEAEKPLEMPLLDPSKKVPAAPSDQ